MTYKDYLMWFLKRKLQARSGVYGFIEHNAILDPEQRIEYIGLNKNFTPLTVNKTDGTYDLGGWGSFPLLRDNKPWMVHSDGTPDYELDENDYTKKKDGSASDVANTSYDGGAFAWIRKIYKQEYMDGTDRVVKFSFAPKSGFEPIGFIDGNDNVLDGVWIPMFYGSMNGAKMTSLSGLQPDYGQTADQQKTAIDAFSTRARFFGGAIVETIIDLMIMFGKSSNTQEVYGNGNAGGYDASLTPTNGVKANTVVGGGQFYGTSDWKSLNKIFHSVVLGSYQQWQRDPYLLCVNGIVKVSKKYEYDVTGATYDTTDVDLTGVEDTNAHYPSQCKVVSGFGSVPFAPPFDGSTSLGLTDALYVNRSITAVARRFGNCNDWSNAGARAISLNADAGWGNWSIGASVLLLPPVA